jgi:DNA-binding IclR family transcriptional regulator
VASPPRLRVVDDPGAIGDGVPNEGVVKSARRVIEVFEFFADRRRPATVGEVAEALGYPQSSTSVLMRSLVRLRYLDYDRETRRFVPTVRVALLGGWIHDQLFSDVSLLRMMQRLRDEAGGPETAVLLGMQNGIYVQYIHVLQPQPPRRFYVTPGSLRPLCRAAIGRVLLSLKPDVEVLSLVRRINSEERDPEKRIRPTELLGELDLIRQQGYAYTEGTVIPGSGVIAMEVPTPPGQPPMALGIGSSIEYLRAERDHVVSILSAALEPYYQSRGRQRR